MILEKKVEKQSTPVSIPRHANLQYSTVAYSTCQLVVDQHRKKVVATEQLPTIVRPVFVQRLFIQDVFFQSYQVRTERKSLVEKTLDEKQVYQLLQLMDLLRLKIYIFVSGTTALLSFMGLRKIQSAPYHNQKNIFTSVCSTTWVFEKIQSTLDLHRKKNRF